MTDNEKIEELSQKISAGLKETFLSENFIKFLQSVALFHHYSLRNLLLIRMQLPIATRVAEYEEWKQLDRYVKRGEKGIAIIVPKVVTLKQPEPVLDETGNAKFSPDGEPITEEANKTFIKFTVTYVYDISQTEGEPVPTISKSLQETVYDNEQLFTSLQKLSSYKVFFKQTDTDAKFSCNYTKQTISIKLGLTDEETVQALIRGVCHAILHMESDKGFQQKQIESECTAFIVSHSLGFDTSFYNFDFVAEWSRTAHLDELYQTLENIQRTANQIMNRLQDELNSLEKVQDKGFGESKNLQSRLLAAAEKSANLKKERELDAVEKNLFK